jgi:adenylate cyclase
LIRTTLTRRIDMAIAILFPPLAVALIAMRRTMVGFALIGFLATLWIMLTAVAFLDGHWLSIMVPLAAVTPTAALYGGGRLWLERGTTIRLAEVQESFRRFHPPAVAERLAADPDFLAEPVRQDAAVVFVDLAGFTGLSETLGPERTREFLKDFHSLVDQVMTAHGGFVLAFMGDGAMITFGFPERRPDDAARALDGVTALHEALRAWTASLPPAQGQGLGARLGAHFGTVVVSRLGGDHHQHITATGDTVNVASRLMEIAKREQATIAISDDLARAAEANERVLRAAGFGSARDVAIRGRSQPLVVRLRR